ncbi:hypothetical protein [Lysinibacillus contaminans]|nr:hypothetical protein [Lysinibacillus contaminans]
MTKLQDSKFETYLVDQEIEIQAYEGKNEETFKEVHYEEFPEGFFTSL